jgi:predicted permease
MATQDIGIDLVSAKFADESVAQVLLFLSITQFAIVTMKFSFSSVLKFSKN